MIDFLEHILIVGTGSSCLIAVFLAVVFLRQKKKHSQTNLVMGLLLIVLACSVALNSYLELLIPTAFPYLHTLPEPFLLLIGPLFYQYIHLLSGSGRPIGKASIHMLPFVLVAAALVYLMIGTPKIEPGLLLDIAGATWLAIYFHFWIYFILNRKILRIYKNELKAAYSTMEGVYQSWVHYCLHALFICYSLLGVLFLLQHGIIFLPINRSLALVLAVMIYCIGYHILMRPELFAHAPRETAEMKPARRPQKYQKSGLRRASSTSEIEKITRFMETRRPHVDPDLDLKKLAAGLQLSPHHLSQLINTELKTSFYDFVNSYRVNEAKRLLLNEANQHLTVLHLAFEAGFPSKATFNRMFKKVTRQTPSQFRARHSHE